jgi:hypothetical protein
MEQEEEVVKNETPLFTLQDQEAVRTYIQALVEEGGDVRAKEAALERVTKVVGSSMCVYNVPIRLHVAMYVCAHLYVFI